jgi:hypothetical protein
MLGACATLMSDVIEAAQILLKMDSRFIERSSRVVRATLLTALLAQQALVDVASEIASLAHYVIDLNKFQATLAKTVTRAASGAFASVLPRSQAGLFSGAIQVGALPCRCLLAQQCVSLLPARCSKEACGYFGHCRKQDF